MRKEIIYVSSLIVVALITAILTIYSKNDQEVILSDTKIDKNMTGINTLTMMYETTAGSGEYTVVTDSTWPGEGYVFNPELSCCENGGTLAWDSDANMVLMQSNASDNCFAYFDKK